MTNLYLQVASFFILILIMTIFFSKKRITNNETKLYTRMLLVGFSLVVVDIIVVAIGYFFPFHTSIIVLNKVYLILILTWIWLMFIYIFNVSSETKKIINKITVKKFSIAVNIILSILIIFLELDLYNSENVMYSFGPSVDILIMSGVIYFLLISFVIVLNYKNIKNRKYLPIVVLVLMILLAILVRSINPGLLITSAVIAYVNTIMYHTIENPDIKMLQQVELAKERADQANSAKSDFLSSMSHEIRTPLNAIVGFSKALEEEPNLSQEGHEEVKDIITASENLLEIVNGILDISKIEAEKLEIVNVEYKPRKIFDELISLTKSRIGEKPIHFTAKYDESMPAILYGDHTRMKQIILNLLTNAAKYTKEGTVNFSISSIKKDNVCRLVISVEDTGIGIKQENINKLFNKFERFDQEKNITIEGTGLGLAITKKLVELMNGKIVVQSVYGQGSKFTVAIDQRIISMELPQEIEELTMEDAKVTIAGKRVLIVDDNKINLKVVERLLRTFKLNIDLVDSGFLAIEKLQQGNTYDLILMDDMMPRMSGVETMKKIKTFPNFTTPMIALTANALTGMKEKYISEGFDDYLAKPIEKEKLEKAIKKYLSK